jgi:hypothetical protein
LSPRQAHERAIADRVAVVKAVCTKLKLTQYNFDALTAEHVAEVTEQLRSRRKEAETELRKLKVRRASPSPAQHCEAREPDDFFPLTLLPPQATGKEEENRLLAKLTELNSTKASAAGSKSNLKTQIVSRCLEVHLLRPLGADTGLSHRL